MQVREDDLMIMSQKKNDQPVFVPLPALVINLIGERRGRYRRKGHGATRLPLKCSRAGGLKTWDANVISVAPRHEQAIQEVVQRNGRRRNGASFSTTLPSEDIRSEANG